MDICQKEGMFAAFNQPTIPLIITLLFTTSKVFNFLLHSVMRYQLHIPFASSPIGHFQLTIDITYSSTG